ncbi:MAG: hypothetical protein AAGK21_04485 [Bacteroidota bacterium]
MAALSVPPLPLFRWAAVVPAALLAAAVAQVTLMLLGGLALSSLYTSGPDWMIWAAKSVASPFMGAAFVAGATWVAPSRRDRVALGAFTGVVVWGVALMVGAGTWGPAMGGLGILGACGVLAVVQRRVR